MPAGHSSVEHNSDGSRFVLKTDPKDCGRCCCACFCVAAIPVVIVDCMGHCVWQAVMGKSCKNCKTWTLFCGCPVRTLDGCLGDGNEEDCYDCFERDAARDHEEVEVVVAAAQPPPGAKLFTEDGTGRTYWWDGQTGQKHYTEAEEAIERAPVSTYQGKRWADPCAPAAPSAASMERDDPLPSSDAKSDPGVAIQVVRAETHLRSLKINRDHEEEPPSDPPVPHQTPIVVTGKPVAGVEGDTRLRPLTVWLEGAGIASTDAVTYAAILVELGVDSPRDLRMLTDTEWPALIKPLHLRKIQDALAEM
jgi:hypothetical protein